MEALVTGPRLFLRHPVADDRDEFIAIREASREFHLPWEPVPEDGSDPIGAKPFEQLVAASNTSKSQKHLMCRVSNGVIVGYVGLSQIFRQHFCSAYMGFWVGVQHTRRSYGTEGIALCLKRAFTQLGLHRVEANIMPGNRASIATIRKCGLKQEGYSPQYLKIAGEWRDHERWAITVRRVGDSGGDVQSGLLMPAHPCHS